VQTYIKGINNSIVTENSFIVLLKKV